MDFSNKQTLVCYVDSDKILFYLGATGALIQLDIPPDVLSYLDLLQKEKFEQLIDSFFQQNKLTEGNCIIVYSTITSFEKDFQEGEGGKPDEEIQKFTDIVPFEDVLSKSYKQNKKTKVVAINNRINESIKSVLEKNKFFIYAVLPVSILQETFAELKTNIDLGFISNKADSIKQFSMINGNISSNPILENKSGSKNESKRIYALGGVFAAMLVILIAVIVYNLAQPPAEKPSGVIGTPPSLPGPVIQETSRSENPTTIIETSSSPSGAIIPVQN